MVRVLPARLVAPAAVAAAVVAGTACVAIVDPGVPGRYPSCPWLALTGYPCPGCGGLRAVHALTRGDVSLAADQNLLVVAAVPVAVTAYLWWLRRRWSGPPPRTDGAGRTDGDGLPRSTYWAVGIGSVVTIAFGILRNLPWFAWLAP
ncbi:MAG: hypothetical protein QG622_838 [Actinomycetota bacterium]|nr:hypothetical protein [Actinomycetota bacterium]